MRLEILYFLEGHTTSLTNAMLQSKVWREREGGERDRGERVGKEKEAERERVRGGAKRKRILFYLGLLHWCLFANTCAL